MKRCSGPSNIFDGTHVCVLCHWSCCFASIILNKVLGGSINKLKEEADFNKQLPQIFWPSIVKSREGWGVIYYSDRTHLGYVKLVQWVAASWIKYFWVMKNQTYAFKFQGTSILDIIGAPHVIFLTLSMFTISVWEAWSRSARMICDMHVTHDEQLYFCEAFISNLLVVCLGSEG